MWRGGTLLQRVMARLVFQPHWSGEYAAGDEVDHEDGDDGD